MKVKFTYTQTMQTAHPKFEVAVFFCINATVNEDDSVIIHSIEFSAATDWDSTDPVLVSLPDESTYAGAIFAGLLREAARNEAYRVSKLKTSN